MFRNISNCTFILRICTSCCFLILLICTSCTTLTQSQVSTVNQFSYATNGLNTSLVTVLETHAKLRGERGKLVAITMKNPDNAIEVLSNSIQQEIKLEKLALRASIAMEFLDSYSELLSILSSDKFTDDLRNKSVHLGTVIDQDILAFNEINDLNVQPFGNIVTDIVRASGGIFIKRMQHKALYVAVNNAEPIIEKITKVIEDLMIVYISSEDGKLGLFENESDEIKSNLKLLLKVNTDTFKVINKVQSTLLVSEQGVLLAKSCLEAAREYRDVHKQLVFVLDNKRDPLTIIEEINKLLQKIKEGKALRNYINESSTVVNYSCLKAGVSVERK